MNHQIKDPVTLLVTGGRNFNDRASAFALFDAMHNSYPNMCLAQGGARGADALAREWCKLRGQPCITMDAQWDAHGDSAGPMRNQWMLEYLRPMFVIAFPGGVGTEDMKRRARAQGFAVYEG